VSFLSLRSTGGALFYPVVVLPFFIFPRVRLCHEDCGTSSRSLCGDLSSTKKPKRISPGA
jgi:hypothetical protein